MATSHGASLLPEKYSWPEGLGTGGCLLACSGGVDSVALLYLLAAALPSGKLRVIYVDHGLHAASGHWGDHVAAHCDALDVQCVSVSVVCRPDGQGLEAAARSARYACFRRHLHRGEVLVLGHHQDDQIETVLMRLLSDARPERLIGMPDRRPLGSGELWRPLLEVSRAEITAWATQAGLQWIEDPSNADTRFRRNYLRHQLLPALTDGFPQIREQLLRLSDAAAILAGFASGLAQRDLQAVMATSESLLIEPFKALAGVRQLNVIRLWLGVQTGEALSEQLYPLLYARQDAEPAAIVGNWELRRYRGKMFRMKPLPERPQQPVRCGMQTGIDLPASCGSLWIEASDASLDLDWVVRWVQGGEQIRLAGRAHSSTLKNLWQAAGVPPWIRQRTPLLYLGEVLIAVADRWQDAQFAEKYPDIRITWRHTLTGDPQNPVVTE